MKPVIVLPLILILFTSCGKPNYLELNRTELTPDYVIISFYLQDYSEKNTEKLANIYLDKLKNTNYNIAMLMIYDKNLEVNELGSKKPSNARETIWYVYPKRDAVSKSSL